MTEQTADKSTKTCPACGEPVPGNGKCCGFSQQYATEVLPVLAELVIESPRRRVPLVSRWVRIGRDPANQVVLDSDFYVSRYHAWVTFEQDKFWLEDLGSTNGTLLNGQAVQKREILNSGDRIKIGETELTFVLGEDTKPLQ